MSTTPVGQHSLLTPDVQPLPQPATIEQRVAAKQRAKNRVLDYFEQREGATRLTLARAIARQLAAARDNRQVTTADVQDEFARRYGADAWLDANGRKHWTGAIFRRNPDFVAVGVTRSPHNHSDDNRVWRLR
jgi:hypothetical protein